MDDNSQQPSNDNDPAELNPDIGARSPRQARKRKRASSSSSQRPPPEKYQRVQPVNDGVDEIRPVPVPRRRRRRVPGIQMLRHVPEQLLRGGEALRVAELLVTASQQRAHEMLSVYLQCVHDLASVAKNCPPSTPSVALQCVDAMVSVTQQCVHDLASVAKHAQTMAVRAIHRQ